MINSNKQNCYFVHIASLHIIQEEMSETTSSQQQVLDPPSQDVTILETHKELIEKKSREIYLAWKLVPPILYFICALTGYSSSILFHIFWHEIFTGHCPLWAQMVPPTRKRVIHAWNSISPAEDIVVDVVIDDWRRNLLITFKFEYHCQFYHAVCLCSCLFGVIWCMLFARCGSGIFAAQWLIIPPALIFQIVFTIVVINTLQDFEMAYASFENQLGVIAPMFMNQTEMAKISKTCELVDHYLKAFNLHPNRICNVHLALQILGWTMGLCWMGGLFFLILRIIVVNDFRLRKTTIYRVPPGHDIPIALEDTDQETEPTISRMKKILFNVFRDPSV